MKLSGIESISRIAMPYTPRETVWLSAIRLVIILSYRVSMRGRRQLPGLPLNNDSLTVRAGHQGAHVSAVNLGHNRILWPACEISLGAPGLPFMIDPFNVSLSLPVVAVMPDVSGC